MRGSILLSLVALSSLAAAQSVSPVGTWSGRDLPNHRTTTQATTVKMVLSPDGTFTISVPPGDSLPAETPRGKWRWAGRRVLLTFPGDGKNRAIRDTATLTPDGKKLIVNFAAPGRKNSRIVFTRN